MGFLDPPPPEHLPRGVVTWPLFAAFALGHVPHTLAGEKDLRWLVASAVLAQLGLLLLAAIMNMRLFATGAMRSRVIRIIAIGIAATGSAMFTAMTAPGAALTLAEMIAAGLGLSIVVRAVVGWKQAV